MVNQPLGVGGKRGAVGGVAQLACERVRQPSATVVPLEAASAGTGQADDRSCCRVEHAAEQWRGRHSVAQGFGQ